MRAASREPQPHEGCPAERARILPARPLPARRGKGAGAVVGTPVGRGRGGQKLDAHLALGERLAAVAAGASVLGVARSRAIGVVGPVQAAPGGAIAALDASRSDGHRVLGVDLRAVRPARRGIDLPGTHALDITLQRRRLSANRTPEKTPNADSNAERTSTVDSISRSTTENLRLICCFLPKDRYIRKATRRVNHIAIQNPARHSAIRIVRAL